MDVNWVNYQYKCYTNMLRTEKKILAAQITVIFNNTAILNEAVWNSLKKPHNS